MSIVWMTSDWHLGHRAIPNYRDQVGSVEENTRILAENYKSVVKSRDSVWFLGDILFEHEYLQTIADLPGTKNLVLGNHCTDKRVKVPQLLEVFHSIHGMKNYKKSWLTHPPMHPCELYGKFNIHGHVHQNTLPYDNYYNVSVDVTNMYPVKYQDICQEMYERGVRG